MKLLFSGKVKDVYEYDKDTFLFEFSDRISAYDVSFHDKIPDKGKTLCDFAEFWFKKLNIKSHFIKRIGDQKLLVYKLKMIPIECIVRGYYYGSLVDRHKDSTIKLEQKNLKLASKLSSPIFDPTTKAKHDRPIDENTAVKMNLVTSKQFEYLKNTSLKIYSQMCEIAQNIDFIIGDLKLEFGILDNEIILADSIGPDEYRLWSNSLYSVGKIQDAFDKQILRDWLIQNGYKKQFEMDLSNNKQSVPPSIPQNIIHQISKRYKDSFELFSTQS